MTGLKGNRQSIVCVLTVGLILSVLPVPAAVAQWPYRSVHGPFVVHADFPLDRLGPLFVELLQLAEELKHRLNLGPITEPIDVYLFADESMYRAYMRRYFPNISPRRAMFIKANSPGNVFAYASPDLETDLRHECTHAVLHASLPLVPLWLDEGLAEYFEVPATRRAFGNPHLSVVRRHLFWKRPDSLDEMETLRGIEQMSAAEYRQAWAWVHFLLHGPEAAQQELLHYVAQLREHQPPRQLSERIRHAFEQPEQELQRHFRRWQR